MIEVSIVPKEHVDLFWGQVEVLLKPAVNYSHGRYLIEDVYNAIVEGTYILWVAYDDGRIIGSAITQIIAYPQKKMLGVAFWGSNEPIESYGPQLLNLLQQYAREAGCMGIEGYGRFGWSRMLKDYGYKKIHEVFELPVYERIVTKQ